MVAPAPKERISDRGAGWNRDDPVLRLDASYESGARLEAPVADILIVGAGPVGLTMAAELARYGVPLRIIDRAARATEHPRSDPTLAEVQAVADARTGGGFRVLDPIWLTAFHINERKVAAYRQNRVFLAGDAAHIHSPAGGQGYEYGHARCSQLSVEVSNGD